MANKNWGIKISCECGTKYYSMNKKGKIVCPTCTNEHVSEDLNIRPPVVNSYKTEPKKKLDEIENIDDTSEEEADDIISLDDQKELEEENDDFKTD